MVHGTHVRATTSGTGQVRSQKSCFPLRYSFSAPSKFSHSSLISLMNSKISQGSFAPAVVNKDEIYDTP